MWVVGAGRVLPEEDKFVAASVILTRFVNWAELCAAAKTMIKKVVK